MALKKIFFTIRNGERRVLMHLRMLSDHPKHGLKKDIFQCLEWLKTRFEAFAHVSRPPEKKKILRLEWLKPCFNAFSHASRPPETWL
jgi:hypothetical protein